MLRSPSPHEIAALNGGTSGDRKAGAHIFSVESDSEPSRLRGLWSPSCSFSGLPFGRRAAPHTCGRRSRVSGPLPGPAPALVCQLLGTGVGGGLGRCRRGGGLTCDRGGLTGRSATCSEAPRFPAALRPAHSPAPAFTDHKLFYACSLF